MALKYMLPLSLLLAAPIATGVAAQPAPAAAGTPAPVVKSAAANRRSAAIERRITELHKRLAITLAEQKPFDDFAQVMRDNARRMDDLVQKHQQTATTDTAIDQMRGYTDMAQAHAEDMQRLTAAFSTLYDSLSADQKKQADQSFRQFSTARHESAG